MCATVFSISVNLNQRDILAPLTNLIGNFFRLRKLNTPFMHTFSNLIFVGQDLGLRET